MLAIPHILVHSCRPIGSSQPTSPGIPIGPGADARVMEEVEQDSCVLTAEQLLHSATRDLSLQARATARA